MTAPDGGDDAGALAADGVGQFDLVGANLARVVGLQARASAAARAVHYRVAWTGARLLRLRDALAPAWRAGAEAL